MQTPAELIESEQYQLDRQATANKAVGDSKCREATMQFQSQITSALVQVQAAQVPEPKESELQAQFAQRTGIRCCKGAREWLESLMAHHSFEGRELRLAWDMGSIGWGKKEATAKVRTPLFEPLFAYSMMGTVAIGCALWSIVFLWLATIGVLWALACVAGPLTIYGAVHWYMQEFLLRPRRIAMRVRCTMPG